MVSRVCPICLRPSPSGKEHPSCSRTLYGSDSPPKLAVGIDDVERLAVETVNRRLALTGVQRKLSLSFMGSVGALRLPIVGALGGTHILKPPAPEYPGMPELEHWTMVLARASGLRTAEAGLIRLSSGEPAFITRRFDRRGNPGKGPSPSSVVAPSAEPAAFVPDREGSRRVHVEDLCQLSGLTTEQKYRSSMEKVGTLVRDLATAPGDDALRLLEVTLFSFLVGNSDMHLKNWTLVRDTGRVVLSPAYDLLPVRLLVDDPEEFALPINGRKNRLQRRDFEALAKHLKIPDIVARRTLDDLPTRLMRALGQLPSPWVARKQAKAFTALLEGNAVRLRGG